MAIVQTPPPFAFEVVAYSTEQAYVWSPQWHAVTGVADIDLLTDVRNVVLGASAGISIKPALQFAPTRTDRPGGGALITAGSAITAASLTHYLETISASDQFFFRWGVGYKLTAGSFARAQGLLYPAFRSKGLILPAEEIVFNPTNDTNAVSYFPLGGGRPLPTNGVDSAKVVVFGMGNLTTTMDIRLAARVFDDPLARGAWTDLGSGWHTPDTQEFEANPGNISLSSLSPTTKHYLELAFAVRKTSGGDTNSRCIFHIIPALTYL